MRSASTIQLMTMGSCNPEWGGLSQSTFRDRRRDVVLETISGAIRRPEDGGDCCVEVSDRDRCVENADGDIVPGLFSIGLYPVCWSAGE